MVLKSSHHLERIIPVTCEPKEITRRRSILREQMSYASFNRTTSEQWVVDEVTAYLKEAGVSQSFMESVLSDIERTGLSLVDIYVLTKEFRDPDRDDKYGSGGAIINCDLKKRPGGSTVTIREVDLKRVMPRERYEQYRQADMPLWYMNHPDFFSRNKDHWLVDEEFKQAVFDYCVGHPNWITTFDLQEPLHIVIRLTCGATPTQVLACVRYWIRDHMLKHGACTLQPEQLNWIYRLQFLPNECVEEMAEHRAEIAEYEPEQLRDVA